MEMPVNRNRRIQNLVLEKIFQNRKSNKKNFQIGKVVSIKNV